MLLAKFVRALGLVVVVGLVGIGAGCGSGGSGASPSDTTKPDRQTLKEMRRKDHERNAANKGVVPGRPAFKKKGMGG
jgi:hypothetical protein